MSNWKEYRLGDCIEFIIDNRGKNPPLSNNGYELIETISINSENKYPDYSKISKFVSKDTYNNWFRKGHPKKGDILISTVGANIGRVSIMNENRGCIAQNLIGLRTDKEKLVPDYLYYFLIKKSTQHTLSSLNIGSAQPSIKVPHLLNILINVPNIQRQEEIANILSSLDEKIELNTQINQTLEQIAQALFKSWFVDFDPVRAKVQALSDGLNLEQAELAAMQAISGKTPEELTALSQAQPDHYAELAETAKAFPCEMVEVDGVEVPKGWLVSTISECSLKIQNGGTPKRSNLEYWENGDISWLSSGEVCNNKVLVQSKEYITDLGLKGSAAKLIPPYSTLVAIYASPTAGKCAFSGFETSTNQAVCAIIPKEEYTFFNYYHLQLQEKYFANQASGSAQQNISKKIIEETPVLIPNKVILKKFNLLAKPIMNKTIENLKENNNLERKRDLLLPKLLNGEVS